MQLPAHPQEEHLHQRAAGPSRVRLRHDRREQRAAAARFSGRADHPPPQHAAGRAGPSRLRGRARRLTAAGQAEQGESGHVREPPKHPGDPSPAVQAGPQLPPAVHTGDPPFDVHHATLQVCRAEAGVEGCQTHQPQDGGHPLPTA